MEQKGLEITLSQKRYIQKALIKRNKNIKIFALIMLQKERRNKIYVHP